MFNKVLLIVLLLFQTQILLGAPIKIGTTVLEGKTTKGDEIRVEITAVNNPKSNPYSIEDAWGTEKDGTKPKIIISSIKIIMNDESERVPVSIYMDLTEPKEAQLIIPDEQTIRLIIKGGVHEKYTGRLIIKGGVHEKYTGYIAEILHLGNILISKSVYNTQYPKNIREDIKYSLMY
ncbi:hypothetical protein EP073_08365 [Geovibrio thiophilus]|uniref:Uncharacterized protein n=1 Tax=Geovibrio thiophilus TaxID=139438 RepID=A0A410JZ25_9BACT|nr:hypothetical protein [Geovibrio thiophilus]QAR33412.1 hypothetical protein EP073_08365 [Geovibrio thiophilus]